MTESVRVYFQNDFDTKASAEKRAQSSRRFVADSLRRYLEHAGREIPKAAIDGVAKGALPDGSPAFVYGPHGKPFFADPSLTGLYFSLSHTTGACVCAVSDAPVGCDIERPKIRDMQEDRFVKIAKRFFAPDEAERIMHDPVHAFFPIWTKKEAFVKWTGKGIAEGLSSFSVFDLPERIVCENVTLAGAEDAVCAICYAPEA
ncbi:MAG: 4'-phosphopantetheinyl transferase superfamily protein [Clostridiales Family XIII bacterium]|nr:4'-phosphopantetheinyl transferase superfamily protein [Clostridiales Family XIII bacterium]